MIFGNHGEEAVIHRAQVAGAQLRLQDLDHIEPFLDGLAGRPAGRQADYGVAFGFNPGDIFTEQAGVGRGTAVFRVAGVEVDNGSPGPGCRHRLFYHLFNGEGQVGRHRRGMGRAADGAGDNTFFSGQ